MNNEDYLGNPHRIAASALLGVPLKKGWTVHHIDGDTKNNRSNNLALCFNKSGHMRIHRAYSNAWHLTMKEATELTKFFKWFTRKYRLMKSYGEKECHITWHNKLSMGDVIMKTIGA